MAQLEEYRRKRHFDATPEPRGKRARKGGNRYVVQKHDARRLHYDFRLEIDGVLKSWAVPKGPSLNPADKRLAVQTEDHPLDYGDFEGTIPERQYGAGTVMVWDQGTFEAVGGPSVQKQLARGELKLLLHGHKLRGGFVLVKLKRSEKGNEWLLIKHKDSAMDTRWSVDAHDGSVLTGRTLSEIAEGLPPADSARVPGPGELPGARKATLPTRLEPMLATLVDKPFSDPAWIYEIKWDGVRTLAWVKGGKLELRSRTGRIVTDQYPEMAVLPERVLARQAILDGEIVVLDDNGRSDFERLQSRMHVSRPTPALRRQAPVVCYLFDIPYCDGYDLRQVPLLERKKFLHRLVDWRDPLRFSDHQEEHGRELFKLAQEQELEGLLGKHARSPYVSRRSPYWMKFKVTKELDAVVGGWTEPRGAREYFGALLLGLYDGKKLRFIGGVGSGFTRKKQKEIWDQLKPLGGKDCPFETVPETKEKAYWCRPELVARVSYGSWTKEGRLRQPVFTGLNQEAGPEECQLSAEVPETRPAVVVRAPAIAGRIIRGKKKVEQELFRGRAETVTLEINGKPVRLSNVNKVYFPESGITKRQVLAYYYQMADKILPFLRNRPLVLRRYPNGITGDSFFQKEAGEGVPDWMETVGVYSEERREEIQYYVANDRAALLYLTNLGCIDHNPWASRLDHLDQPDYFIVDLDPTDDTPYHTVVEVARVVHRWLEKVGLKTYLKTSGATGLHLYVPVERHYTYEQVRTFAEIVARFVARDVPKLVTQERSVGKRPKGRVYLDVYQNALGRPLAAPFSVRAFPQAPVSAPLRAKELRRSLRAEKLNLRTIQARLAKQGDPWADFWRRGQRLEKATALLSDLLKGAKKK